MVDMQSVFTLMYGAAANGQDPFGAVLNFGTAMQVIAGVCWTAGCCLACTAQCSITSFGQGTTSALTRGTRRSLEAAAPTGRQPCGTHWPTGHQLS